MNARRIYLVVLVVILSWAASAGPAFAANQQTEKDQFRALLDADVENLLRDNPEHVLMFYQFIEKGVAANKDKPLWKLFPLSDTPSDPIMIAQWGEIGVQGKDLPLSQATKEFVEADRQQTLNLAIDLTQAEFSGAARMAAEVIKQYRDDLTGEQWKKIVDGRQYVIRHRDKYPAGINTWADGFSHVPYGYVFFKNTEGRCVDSQTIYYVDGKQKYPNSMHGLGWRSDLPYVGFEKLSVESHKIQLKTTYKFQLDAVEFEGTNESEEFEIEITPAGSPDNLAAVADEKLIAEVEAAVVVGEKEDGHEYTYSRRIAGNKSEVWGKVWVPAIKVVNPLPVSLQMKPEIHIEGMDKPLTRYVLRVPPGKTAKRILENWAGDRQLADLMKERADAEGKLKAKLVLRPSRAHALSDPAVESYYPRVIEREIEFSWRPVE